MPNRRNILLLLKKFNHPAYEGIVAYAREAKWRLELRYDFYRQLPKHWQGDGIISHHSDDPEMVELIETSGAMAVDIGFRSKRLNTPQVWPDSEAIGQLAARYFLDKGFRNFGFYKYFPHIGQFPWHAGRYNGFRNTVENHGCSFVKIWDRGQPTADQLREVPKPLAVLANNDLDALTVLEACEEAGLRVPEEVALLGVNNNPDFCDLARIPLSSIDSNGWGIGHEAATLLDRLMDGQAPPEKPILIPPIKVVTRQSTDILAVPHLPTAKALRLLMQNFKDTKLNLNTIARDTGLSRRNLEKGFKRHLSKSMHEYLEKLRLDEAVDMLGKSTYDDYKGYEIAAACGFSDNNHLSRVLRKYTGKTFRQMRG